MKLKITLIIVLTLFVGITSFAQPQNIENRIKSLKIGYITETLELTSNEAEKFWPIYNLHQDKVYQLRVVENRKLRHQIKDDTTIDAMSDDEASIILDKMLKMDKEIQLEKASMFEELKSILPPKKLLKLHKAEHGFNRKILEQFKKQRRKEGERKK